MGDLHCHLASCHGSFSCLSYTMFGLPTFYALFFPDSSSLILSSVAFNFGVKAAVPVEYGPQCKADTNSIFGTGNTINGLTN